MDILKALNERRSVKADLLVEPAPRGEDLIEILQTGMSAPDHGVIRPWRFTIIDGEDRNKLGDIFAEALQQDKPESTEEDLNNIRAKPLRAPLIVTIWAEITEDHPKVPPAEQIVATSCAAENILLATQAKGFGGVLLTGWPAFHNHVKKSLGMADKD
ncbi:nitroreductase family protein, partial [Curvivirga aplysinae]|uniref:nitroreductase family protein n=1 Tax=Curvivirga aplysinae TaxID=2529852 RepID=UPI0012BCC77C